MMTLLSVASASIAVFGVWGFFHSLGPIPNDLRTVVGTVSNVRTSTAMYSRAHATFQLKQANGEIAEFSYSPMFKRFYYFADNLKDGVTVEVTTGPNGRNDFWGIKLDTKTLMTPAEARDARLTDGKWGLVLFAGFLASAAWSARQGQLFRRKGV